jgi:hypothetical protein
MVNKAFYYCGISVLYRNPQISDTLAWAQFLITITRNHSLSKNVISLDLARTKCCKKTPCIHPKNDPFRRKICFERLNKIFPFSNLLVTDAKLDVGHCTMEIYHYLYRLLELLFSLCPIFHNIFGCIRHLNPCYYGEQDYEFHWKILIIKLSSYESFLNSIEVCIMQSVPETFPSLLAAHVRPSQDPLQCWIHNELLRIRESQEFINSAAYLVIKTMENIVNYYYNKGSWSVIMN